MKKYSFYAFMCLALLFIGCEKSDPFEDKVSDGAGVEVPSLVGAFSVSPELKVLFSPGNLQYHAKENQWRFAANQWDYLTEYVKDGSDWVDLFLWQDFGANVIGKDSACTWRSLEFKEWCYLMEERYNADVLYGIANVNGVNGLVLLPDTWKCPDGLTFVPGFSKNVGDEYFAKQQTYHAEEWSKMEAAGAVFLPAAGYYSSYMYYQGNQGNYWMQTKNPSPYDAGVSEYYRITFLAQEWMYAFNQDGSDPWMGKFYFSARLVKNL